MPYARATNTVSARPVDERPTTDALRDAAFLVVVVALSLVVYVGGLGFYSDDWAFLGMLRNGPDQSLAGLIELQYEGNPNLKLRPTQVVFQAILYKLFGLEPLGYHMVNALVLATLTVLFFLAFRELALPRLLAISIPAVYILLPHYSTNRFWFASFGYALSIALYFLALYADLRAARAAGLRLAAWKSVALAALVAACFGYEVVVPLFLLLPLLTEWSARRHGRRLGHVERVLFHGPTLALLALAVAYKATTTEGGLAGAATYYVKQLFFGSLTISFGSYGLALPEAAWWGVRELDAAGIAVGVLLTTLVFGYVFRLARSPGQLLTPKGWLELALAGLAVFALGYAVFLTTVRILFTSTGIANRSTMAGTIGVAIVFVAVVGLLAGRFRASSRPAAFGAAVAVLCGASFVVNNGLARAWVEAWEEERRVLAGIEAALPEPQPRTTVLLHGVCPYRGPAIVFESNWDLEGALRARYRDATLEADTTETTLTVGRRGVSTLLYGVIPASYPYSERLLLFDAARGNLHAIPDREAFLDTVARAGDTRCASGEAGKGVTIFSTDRLYRRLEARGFSLLP